jgi:hypothetical protein
MLQNTVGFLPLPSAASSCQGYEGHCGKHRLQRSVVKFDEEGEHLRREGAVLHGEVDADNASDRSDRIGFPVLLDWNVPAAHAMAT